MPDSTREEIAKLEALYANNPAGRVFTHLAEAYRKAGDLERARGILDEGLQKHPEYASAYVVLGRVLQDLQETEPAGDAFRRVLELDPHNLVALRSLGDLARSAGHTEEAVRYFEELRQQDPGNDEIEQTITELRTGERAAAREEAAEWSPASGSTDSHESTYEMDTVAPEGLDATIGETTPSQDEWSPYQETSRTVEFHAAETGFEEYAETDPAAERTSEAESVPADDDFQLGWVASSEEAPAPEMGAELGEIASLSAAAETSEWEKEGPSDELGDLSSIGAAAQQFEIEGETFAPEDLDLGMGQAPGVDESIGAGELVTETIAELYRKQGLYDRAAEAYRTLLSERPGDAGLEARLAEVEALDRPSLADEATEADAIGVEPAEPDSEDAAPWLSGGSAAAESPPSPYAWTEQPAEAIDEPGQPIRVYFNRLLAWQPQPAVTTVGDGGAATATEAFDEWFGRPEAAPVETVSQPHPSSGPPAEAAPLEPAGDRDDDDDDDLEMFRSWLQSLKK